MHSSSAKPATHNPLRDWAVTLLSHADIRINGDRPWDMQVHNDALFKRVVREGSLGLGEAYMDGWWDCAAIDEFFGRALSAHLESHLGLNRHVIAHAILGRIMNMQSSSRSFQVGERHYDIGNELYTAMLDPHMIYSCGYWRNASTLAEAQTNKLDLICKKLQLKKGQKLLDIGCGWGGLAAFAARHYGVEVTGVTISKEQAALAVQRCRDLPVEICLVDYRTLTGSFDRIVSVGMFEHVGHKNYRTYMEVAARCLKDDGLFLLHTIGNARPSPLPDPWIDRYIFPNGILPASSQVTHAYEGLFVMEDWHNFGPDYDKTLMAWHANFEKAWPSLKGQYDERFYRMWTYYLLSCAGFFRSRKGQLWQVVLSKNGVKGGYESVR